MTKYIYKVPTEDLDSLEKVSRELDRLNQYLVETELNDLVFFNQAYKVMTQNISEALKREAFLSPDLIEDLVVSFAGRYFKAINAHVSGLPVPAVWSRVTGRFYDKPSYIALLLGASAHINFDLPLALHEVVDIPEEFETDFTAINKILIESTKQLLKSFETNNHTRSLIIRLNFLYEWLLLKMLISWRHRAWENFLSLKQGSCNPSQLKTQSLKTSNQLLSVGLLLS